MGAFSKTTAPAEVMNSQLQLTDNRELHIWKRADSIYEGGNRVKWVGAWRLSGCRWRKRMGVEDNFEDAVKTMTNLPHSLPCGLWVFILVLRL